MSEGPAASAGRALFPLDCLLAYQEVHKAGIVLWRSHPRVPYADSDNGLVFMAKHCRQTTKRYGINPERRRRDALYTTGSAPAASRQTWVSKRSTSSSDCTEEQELVVKGCL